MALESGLARAKNSINVAVKNLGDFVIAAAGFWLIGFGLMFGASRGGIVGGNLFFLGADHPWTVMFFVFQVMFVGTSATIVSGAIAERTRFAPYLVVSFAVSVVIYPVFGHWAWGGLLLPGQQGWLEALGFIDFAGSTVVHSVGGWVALATAWMVGPRKDKFDEHGKPRHIRPHNLQLAYVGVFLLFFGWFGFNAGSTLAVTTDIAGILMNTVLAAVFGALSAGALQWYRGGHKAPEPEALGNGVLAGLVGVTAGAASLEPMGAVMVGLISGILLLGSAWVVENVLKVDDVVGAVSVHGACGLWGTLAVGIFAPQSVLEPLGTTRFQLIGVQSLGVIVAFGWAFGVGAIVVFCIKKTIGLRAPFEDEQIGMNISEHGASSALLNLATHMHRAQSVSSYDDSLKVDVEIGTEVGELSELFNGLIEALKDFENTAGQVDALERANLQLQEQQRKEHTLRDQITTERAARNHELARMGHATLLGIDAIQKQFDRLVEFISAIERVSGTWFETQERVAQVTQDIERIGHSLNGHTQRAGDAIDRSRESFHSTETTVASLKEYTHAIAEATAGIDEVSAQIRLLSINAAVEAARSGDGAGGFTVIAHEIRALAGNSASSVENITDKVKRIEDTTRDMVEHVQTLSRATGALQSFQDSVDSSVGAERTQVSVLGSVLETLTQQSQALVEELAAAKQSIAPVFTALQESRDQLNSIIHQTQST